MGQTKVAVMCVCAEGEVSLRNEKLFREQAAERQGCSLGPNAARALFSDDVRAMYLAADGVTLAASCSLLFPFSLRTATPFATALQQPSDF